MKIQPITWTWILRGIGLLCLLPVLFTNQFLWIFPGLEPRHFQILLYVGTLLFVAGAVLYYVFRRKAKSSADDDLDSED